MTRFQLAGTRRLPFPLLSSLPEERDGGFKHESHQRGGHIPLGGILSDDRQEPDRDNAVQTEQRSDEYRACNDEPSHHASRLHRHRLPV